MSDPKATQTVYDGLSAFHPTKPTPVDTINNIATSMLEQIADLERQRNALRDKLAEAERGAGQLELAALTWLLTNIAWGDGNTTAYSIHQLVSERRKELVAALRERGKS